MRSATLAGFAALMVTAASLHGQETVPFEVVEVEENTRKAMGGESLNDFTTKELSNLPPMLRLAVRVVVPDTIRRSQVRPTVEAIIARLTSERPDADEIYLRLYSSRDRAQSGGPQDVGSATWSTGGQLGGITPEIARSNLRSTHRTTVETKSNLEEYLRQIRKQTTYAGLSESKRREIYRALLRAEDRAGREAQRKYPTMCVDASTARANMKKNGKLRDSLTTAYERRVRERYGITESTVDSIDSEALTEQWPMPEMKPMPGCP